MVSTFYPSVGPVETDGDKSVLAGQCSQYGELQVHQETLSQQYKIESRERHLSMYLYVETYCRVKGPTGAEKNQSIT